MTRELQGRRDHRGSKDFQVRQVPWELLGRRDHRVFPVLQARLAQLARKGPQEPRVP